MVALDERSGGPQNHKVYPLETMNTHSKVSASKLLWMKALDGKGGQEL